MFDGGGGALIGAFVTLGLLMAIVAVITGRRLTDDTVLRPRAIYLSVAMLPTLVVGVLAVTAAVEAVVRLILGPESALDLLGELSGGISTGVPEGLGEGLPEGLGGLLGSIGDFGLDPTDAAIRTLVGAGITAVVALGLYAVHRGWRESLIHEAGFLGSPAARVLQAFAYVVVLIFVVVGALAAVKAGYGVFRTVAPGTSAAFPIGEQAEREAGIADLVSGVALAAASWWLLQMHWKLAGTWRGEVSTRTAPPAPAPPATS